MQPLRPGTCTLKLCITVLLVQAIGAGCQPPCKGGDSSCENEYALVADISSSEAVKAEIDVSTVKALTINTLDASNFDAPITTNTSWSNIRTAAAADLDNDGISDLIVGRYGGDSFQVFLGRSGGAFKALPAVSIGTVPVTTYVYEIQVGDIDGDDHLDVVFCGGNGDIRAFYGDGKGNFPDWEVRHITGADFYSAALTDLDGDGKLDLALPNYQSSTGEIIFLINPGVGSRILSNWDYSIFRDLSADWRPYLIASGDINKDGNKDLVVTSYADLNGVRNVYLLINRKSGTTLYTAYKQTANFPRIESLAIEDINNDGKPDIVLAKGYLLDRGTTYSDELVILKQKSSWAPRTAFDILPGIVISGDNRIRSVKLVDLDNPGDGYPEIVMTGYKSGEFFAIKNRGAGRFAVPGESDFVRIAVGPYNNSVAVGDFTNDGILDLAGPVYLGSQIVLVPGL